jgi:hypothetical protein
MLVAVIILAGIALSFGLEDRKRIRESLNEIKKTLGEYGKDQGNLFESSGKV